MDVLAKIGVDWRLLLAQGVNFAILFYVLRRFAYRPILDFLEQRTERIERGLKDAEAAQAKLAEMEVKEKAVLAAARVEARDIIVTAEEAAKKRDGEIHAQAEEKVKHLLEASRVKIEEERRKTLAEAKDEIAAVVNEAVEKILRERVDAVKDRELIGRI